MTGKTAAAVGCDRAGMSTMSTRQQEERTLPRPDAGEVRIEHTASAEDYTAIGRDIESVVLARAVKLHVERRVFINGDCTVVFG